MPNNSSNVWNSKAPLKSELVLVFDMWWLQLLENYQTAPVTVDAHCCALMHGWGECSASRSGVSQCVSTNSAVCVLLNLLGWCSSRMLNTKITALSKIRHVMERGKLFFPCLETPGQCRRGAWLAQRVWFAGWQHVVAHVWSSVCKLLSVHCICTYALRWGGGYDTRRNYTLRANAQSISAYNMGLLSLFFFLKNWCGSYLVHIIAGLIT